MPLLVSRTTTPPVTPAPEPPVSTFVVDASWVAPDGTALDLMEEFGPTGVVILGDGVAGLGAAPRAVTRRSLATGGAYARWSHSDERIITLPLLLFAPTPQEFLALRRAVTRAFVQTTPAAGVPEPGTFRVTRSDGSWREIRGVYLSGLDWQDSDQQGVRYDPIVMQLLCEPWWYGANTIAAEFGVATGEGRNYLSPYETVSTSRTLGEVTVNVMGDQPVSPVWTITGPADVVTVKYATGNPQWIFRPVAAGEVITIDTERFTVTDQTDRNRIGDLQWPTSSLYPLQPGTDKLSISIVGGSPGVSSVRMEYRPRWETA